MCLFLTMAVVVVKYNIKKKTNAFMSKANQKSKILLPCFYCFWKTSLTAEAADK